MKAQRFHVDRDRDGDLPRAAAGRTEGAPGPRRLGSAALPQRPPCGSRGGQLGAGVQVVSRPSPHPESESGLRSGPLSGPRSGPPSERREPPPGPCPASRLTPELSSPVSTAAGAERPGPPDISGLDYSMQSRWRSVLASGPPGRFMCRDDERSSGSGQEQSWKGICTFLHAESQRSIRIVLTCHNPKPNRQFCGAESAP